MPKLFIAGHSDSGGGHLPGGVLAWPERSRDWLEQETGSAWEIEASRFAPVGPRAADYLLGKVAEAQPDIVVIPLTAYVCTVGTVAESVRARFGIRAQRAFSKTEQKFQARTRQGRVRKLANGGARRVARRLLGARPLATVEQTIAIFEDILHRLAQVESLQVIAVADARFSVEVQSREPRLQQRMDRLNAALLPVAEGHRFLAVDLEGALRRSPDRSAFYQEDGIHTTAAFHDVYFDVLKPALAEAAGAVTRPRA